MKKLQVDALDIARRFIGVKEAPGTTSNPAILAMLKLDAQWPEDDSRTPWCSGFVNWVAWLLQLPRSRSLAARSWLKVGTAVRIEDAVPGFDVVILSRGPGPQPGPEVLDAPGHVGFFVGREEFSILVLGGNQGDMVSVAPFSLGRLLGVRRLV